AAAARARAGEHARTMAARGVETLGAAGNISARAEGAAGAGNDHGAYRIVAVRAPERVGDLCPHLAGISLELLRPVQRDDHEGTVELAAYMFVVHRGPLSSRAAPA